MNAIEKLKKDHRKVDALFESFDEAEGGQQRQAIVQKIIHELRTHAAVEEHVFYPAVEAQVGKEVQGDVAESVEEHLQVKRLLDDLNIMDPSHPQYAAKVHVLKETVQHHVQEEESEMFPEVRESMSDGALEKVGNKLDQDREQVEKQITAAEEHDRSQRAP